jgi:hypothetical protein
MAVGAATNVERRRVPRGHAAAFVRAPVRCIEANGGGRFLPATLNAEAAHDGIAIGSTTTVGRG